MKKWMLWIFLLIALAIIGAAVGGGIYVMDPKKACRDSGGHWVKDHCEY